MTVMRHVRDRVRREARRSARRVAPAARTAAQRVREAVPESVRKELYPVVPWRPWRVDVRLEDLLLGVMGPQTASEFAESSHDLLWPSTRLAEGPHVQLLADVDRGELTDAEILAHPYGEMGRTCLRLHGRYFWATDDEGVVDVARDFIRRYRGEVPTRTRAHQSPAGSPLMVAPVRWTSGLHQIVDGHHRAAIEFRRGRRTLPAKVKWLPVTTPLQDLLNQMSWIGGEKELYQPIDAPELREAWVTVRRCTDRLEKMVALLDDLGISAGGRRYLDVACCYGWFPAQMEARGFDARGIERDPLAPRLAEAAYGLSPDRVLVGDAVDLLASQESPHDVVSCFSLLHHFVLGRGSTTAEELLSALDRATGSVLFIDTGQGDEAWFADSLAGWNPAHIEAYLRRHTSFDDIIDLGPDEDAVGPFRDNYGRHLFACVRRDR